MKGIKTTSFNFSDRQIVYHGKVRDVYFVDKFIIMIASDRISAFDHILPKPIPGKGQILNQLAAYFLRATSDVVPNWFIDTPDPNVSVGYLCEPFKVEMVIRGYLAGHAWRVYQSGGREICGVGLPDGLKENDPLPMPIITPTTKAAEGHDEDISREQILSQNLVSEEHYEILEEYTRMLYQDGSAMAKERGLILVDTKYEFGLFNGEVLLMDEIHTPDSSRYFYLDGYEARQKSGEKQKQLSKEFVREWLMANNFQGKNGELIPDMPDDFINLIQERYTELYERLTNSSFILANDADPESRIFRNVASWLETQGINQ
jgi:phosphoribosylaminoimidazole-succinocarboxamide synthase